MAAERIDKGTASEHQDREMVRLDRISVDDDQPDKLKGPLEFASTRLRKKLGVRRAIRESRSRRVTDA